MTSSDLQLCTDLRWGYVKYPCYVEPKVDGFRCLVTVDDDGTVHAWSRSGREWPKVAAALSELQQFPGCWFDGEIQISGSWAATNAAKNRGWVFDPDSLMFAIFDMPKPLFKSFYVECPTGRCGLLMRLTAECRAEVELMYSSFLAQGYEGIVVKNLDAPYTAGRSGHWMRLKPAKSKTDDRVRDEEN